MAVGPIEAATMATVGFDRSRRRGRWRALEALGRLVVVVALSLTSGCWLQPGFDAGQTSNSPLDVALDSTTITGLTELWDVPVSADHAPVGWGDTIYVTSEESGGTATAVDAVTGTIAWQRDELWQDAGWSGPGGVGAPVHYSGELVVPVWSSPGAGGWSWTGTILRLDPDDGDFLGTLSLDAIASSPITDLAVADGELAGHQANIVSGIAALWIEWKWPGQPALWATTPSYPQGGSFAIVGDRIMWSDGTKATGYRDNCQTAGTCAPDWATELGVQPGQPVAVNASTVVYPASNTLRVLDTTTGATLWTAAGGPQIAVAGGAILTIDHTDLELLAYPRSGCGTTVCSPLWTASVAAFGQPVIGDDVVYVLNNGSIDAFAQDGCGTATCSPLATIATGHTWTGNPIFSDGRLVTQTAGGIVAYGLPE